MARSPGTVLLRLLTGRLDWATVRGHRAGENPARWRGHLDKLLPALKKKQRVKHHAALPFAEVGRFITALRDQEGMAAHALEFTILTAARTNEVIGACWGEFDLKKHLWTIPAARMKSHREHRVPLSPEPTKLLLSVRPKQVEGADFVFPGAVGSHCRIWPCSSSSSAWTGRI